MIVRETYKVGRWLLYGRACKCAPWFEAVRSLPLQHKRVWILPALLAYSSITFLHRIDTVTPFEHSVRTEGRGKRLTFSFARRLPKNGMHRSGAHCASSKEDRWCRKQYMVALLYHRRSKRSRLILVRAWTIAAAADSPIKPIANLGPGFMYLPTASYWVYCYKS